MTMDEMPCGELSFSPDFASRVLNEANRVALRRRRIVRASALSAAFAVTGAFGLWSVTGSRAPMRVDPATVATSTDAEPVTLAQSAQSEPLDYMFPEATPLAELADQYASETAGGVTARRDMLFAGDTGQDVE